MRLLSWNVRGVVQPDKVDRQITAILSRQADLVALQDVHPRAAATYLDCLQPHGLRYGANSITSETVRRPNAVGTRAGVLVASRWPIERILQNDANLTFSAGHPERSLSLTVAAPFARFELYTLYAPNPLGPNKEETSRRREAQRAVLDGLYAYLARTQATPKVVCGDFNVTDLRRFGDVQTIGLRDVHAWRRPWRSFDSSWHGPGNRYSYRLDYVLASDRLRPRSSRYLYQFGRHTLSDHSPQEVDFGIGEHGAWTFGGILRRAIGFLS